ncbi:MAG TPA: LysE family transporter [Solirubrobacter sp.]|nr:LysE family transporter [Solirubrobacter sp.]
MHALSIGFGLGFLVAMQLGPMSLFLIRSTLRSGWTVGLAIGAGIALIDALYAAAGAAGAASLLAIDPLRTTLSLLGAAVLLAIGVRTLRDAFRVRIGAEADHEVSSPRRAFATSAAATASNPLTIASWAAVFAAASGVGAAGGPMLLVAGVGIGSLCWVTLLATGTAAARRSLGARAVRVADAVAGAGLIFFGFALALRAD